MLCVLRRRIFLIKLLGDHERMAANFSLTDIRDCEATFATLRHWATASQFPLAWSVADVKDLTHKLRTLMANKVHGRMFKARVKTLMLCWEAELLEVMDSKPIEARLEAEWEAKMRRMEARITVRNRKKSLADLLTYVLCAQTGIALGLKISEWYR